MTNCTNCGAIIENGGTICQACANTPVDSFDEANPYAATDASIQGDTKTENESPPETVYGISFGVSETVGETFSLWSDTLWRLILISLFPVISFIPTAIIVALLLSGMVLDKGIYSPYAAIAVGTVGIIIMTVLQCAATAGSFLLIEDQVIYRKKERGVFEAFIEGFHYLGRFIGLGILIALVLGVLSTPAAIFLAYQHFALAAIFGFAAMAAGCYMFVRWCAVAPIMVLEDRGVFESMGLSADLVYGNAWIVLSIQGVILAILMGVTLVSALIGLIPIIGQLANLAINVAISPFVTVGVFALWAGLKDLHESAASAKTSDIDFSVHGKGKHDGV